MGSVPHGDPENQEHLGVPLLNTLVFVDSSERDAVMTRGSMKRVGGHHSLGNSSHVHKHALCNRAWCSLLCVSRNGRNEEETEVLEKTRERKQRQGTSRQKTETHVDIL